MSLQVKICGLTREVDIEVAIRYGASMLGFIVEAESPRRLTVARAAKLSKPAKSCTKTVAVTVNPTEKLAAHIGREMAPDYIQIHGRDVSPDMAREIRAQSGAGIIRAIAVRSVADIDAVQTWESVADLILLDAAPPVGSTQQGGHGKAFDWNLARGIQSEIPLMLAGGLNPDNAITARQTGFQIFDISSGLESGHGVKDPAKIKVFMKAILHG